MVSGPGSPTAANQMKAIQRTESIIEEPQLLRLKLSRKSHKGHMRRLVNQALGILQNEDSTLEAWQNFTNKVHRIEETCRRKTKYLKHSLYWKNRKQKAQKPLPSQKKSTIVFHQQLNHQQLNHRQLNHHH